MANGTIERKGNMFVLVFEYTNSRMEVIREDILAWTGPSIPRVGDALEGGYVVIGVKWATDGHKATIRLKPM